LIHHPELPILLLLQLTEVSGTNRNIGGTNKQALTRDFPQLSKPKRGLPPVVKRWGGGSETGEFVYILIEELPVPEHPSADPVRSRKLFFAPVGVEGSLTDAQKGCGRCRVE